MIDEMLEELESVGTVDSVGEFTMDRSKARDKMRRFQLADPRSYVLELVQAASLKGATRIRFDIDSRDMRMQFDGRPFTADDFDDIYGAAFTRRLDHDVLARRQLALGVNSAMALTPSQITVESGDGSTGARLSLEPEQDDSYETIETERVGTLVHVRERFSLGTFVAVFKNMTGTLAEEQLLRARCGFASFEIDLEGKRLDRGLVPHRGDVLELVRTEHGGTIVAGGFGKEFEAVAWLDIVKDGVWISTHRLPTGRYSEGFKAVVQDHALRKDVSQSDVVRDEAYERMLDVVERCARQAQVALAKQVEVNAAPRWAEAILIEQMLRLAREGTVLDEDPEGLRAALRHLPLFETTAERWVSLDDLLAEAKTYGSIVYVNGKRWGGAVPPGHSFVVYMRLGRGIIKQSIAVLRQVFHGRTREVSGLLAQMEANEKARKAWRARRSDPVLPEGAYMVRRAFEGPGLKGELGITANVTSDVRIGYVVDGCLLSEEEIDLPLPGLRVMLESEDFEPTPSYDGIAVKAVACRAVLRIVGELGPLYAELARNEGLAGFKGWRQTCAMSFLQAALEDEDLADQLANELGFPTSAFAAAQARMEPVETKLSLGLGAGTPHPVTMMPLFSTLGSTRYSLAQLSERAKDGKAMLAVRKTVPGVDADILVLSNEVRESIEHLFPGGFEDGWPEVERFRKHAAFLARPAHESNMSLLPDLVTVPIEGPGITGELGVMPKAGHLTRRRDVQVLHQGRLIDAVHVLMVGTCVGWVESESLRPKRDYSGVKSGKALDAVRAAVLRAFARACLEIAEQARAQMTVDRRAFLREVAALMFPTRSFRLAFERIARDKDTIAAERAKIYRWLYAGLQTAADSAAFEQRLWRLTRSKTPLGDSMAIPVPKGAIRWALTAVDILFPAGDEPHRFLARARRPASPIGELPLFKRHDGRTAILRDLTVYLDRRATVMFIDEPHSIDLGERVMLVAGEVHRDQLRRIIGSSGLLNGSGMLERERNRLALQAQRPVESVALAAGDALISVRVAPGGTHTSEGEIGFVLEHPADPQRDPRVRMVAFRERRRIQSIEVGKRSYELVAAINDDRFVLSFNNKEIRQEKRFEAAVERCEAAVPQLIGALVSRWSTLSSSARSSAWRHVLDFMVARRPSKVDHWLDESALDPMVAVVARLPGFATVGGPLVSMADLVKVEQERGCVEVLPAPAEQWDRSPFGPERPIVVADPYELEAMRSLFVSVESVLEQWPRWKARELWKSASTRQALPRPEDCIVVVDLPGPVVKGRLAISNRRAASQIDLCTEGFVVESETFEYLLPCVGSVSGEGIIPDDTWTDVRLRDDAQASLRHASIQLHIALARWYGKHAFDPRRTWAGSLLFKVVVELRQQERGAELEPALRSLLDELRSLAVIPVGSGRHISLETALEEKPALLGHLDLWDSAATSLLQAFDERDAQARVQEVPLPSAKEVDESLETILPTSPPTPSEQLLDAIRAELSLVRARNRSLLTHVHLDRITVGSMSLRRRSLVAWADDSGVVVNGKHAVVRRALEHPEDPVWRSYVCSAVYTALNVWLEEVTDTDEMHFLGLMGQLVGSG